MLSRRHERILTATTSDLFSATDLRQAPGPGAVGIWAASDVSDSTISVRVGAQVYANATLIPNRGTNAPIVENNDGAIAMAPVRGGELINIDVTEVTAMNARVLAVWFGR